MEKNKERIKSLSLGDDDTVPPTAQFTRTMTRPFVDGNKGRCWNDLHTHPTQDRKMKKKKSRKERQDFQPYSALSSDPLPFVFDALQLLPAILRARDRRGRSPVLDTEIEEAQRMELDEETWTTDHSLRVQNMMCLPTWIDRLTESDGRSQHRSHSVSEKQPQQGSQY